MERVIESIKANVERRIIGKGDVIDLMLTALLAKGHVLLEDMPGTGKTVLAKSIAASMDGTFSRIQFTPDLLPSDVTGLNIFHRKENEFLFHKGPVFANVVLADEINRATPRTQASLLECMEERQVTVDGVTRSLELPFFVMATQNPIETAGTFPLPEAQLDRFMLKLSMGALELEQEKEVLRRFVAGGQEASLEQVANIEEIVALQKRVSTIYVHEELITYIQAIAQETRRTNGIAAGVSTRATIALLHAAQAFALLKGREYVVSEDIKYLAPFVFSHRLIMEETYGEQSAAEKKMHEILERVAVPTEDWSRSL